ncbi:hypothetical protein E8E13_007660 [Curvularia kusanoi]|uniref:Ribonuclease P/MRP protein subunit POP5 n=1 Tax=Curvularia kusanoi TaxID=90978 RepID=A0A9P4WCM6_CURKU|nr:hypothetical protein E8E13_007660 [Curvularia kusanoi]
MVRVKFRYLVVNFLYPTPAPKSRTALPDLVQIHSPTPDAFNAGALVRLLRDAIEDLYGDYGSGMVSSSLKVNYFSPATSTAIIRCPRDHFELVWAALTFVTKLPRADIPVVCRVVRVSATIKKAEEEVIRRSRAIVKRAKAAEDKGADPMLRSVEKSVERDRRETVVVIDDGHESGDMSE